MVMVHSKILTFVESWVFDFWEFLQLLYVRAAEAGYEIAQVEILKSQLAT